MLIINIILLYLNINLKKKNTLMNICFSGSVLSRC